MSRVISASRPISETVSVVITEMLASSKIAVIPLHHLHTGAVAAPGLRGESVSKHGHHFPPPE